MKIVIAGAGEVGTHLARLLSKEYHDITVIDEKAKRLNVLEGLDIRPIQGSPTCLATLDEAEVQKANLFIGVTPDESKNMSCCMLAKYLGAKKTVARVENYEYTQETNRTFFKTVGIDSVVYPEQLAAREINHLIDCPWVRQWWEIQDGRLLLFAVKIRRDTPILNKLISEISGPEDPFHITAIKRNGETVIPHGSDMLQEDDLAFVITTPCNIKFVQQLIGKNDNIKAEHVFYMGASDTVIQSINSLDKNIQVKLFDSDIERALEVNEAVNHKRLLQLNGDGRDFELLQEEGIKHAHVFVAATQNSETNILACMAARRWGVPKTIAMVENTDYISMAEQLDIGSIINKKTFAAGHIYRMLLKADVESIKSLTIAQADVIEFHVNEESRITRKPIRDLRLPASVNIGGYIRDGKGHLANGDTTFQADDIVVAFCLQGELKKLETFFK